jgi:hypothetical protein
VTSPRRAAVVVVVCFATTTLARANRNNRNYATCNPRRHMVSAPPAIKPSHIARAGNDARTGKK